MRELSWKSQVALAGFGFALSILVIVGWAVQNHAEAKARTTLLSDLGQLKTNAHVRLNDRDVGEAAPFLLSLNRLTTVQAHHSSPTTSIQVEIDDGSSAVVVVIARDSERPDEYWIFRPDASLPNEPNGRYAGRVSDPHLSALLRRWGL